jgi:hypothetical protein
MNKQLLIDYAAFQVKPGFIAESRLANNGRVLVKGVLQRADAENQNRRVYPESILKPAVNKYINTYIKENRALGELDHPDSEVINLNNVSHKIVEIHWQGKDVVGTVEILNTPAGKILQELLDAGIALGISSRGSGSVQKLEGVNQVQEDFELVCWDFVSNPSTHGAFMRPLQESANNNINRYDVIETLIQEIACDISGVCECKIL